MFVIIVTRQNWSTREVWPAGPGLDCSNVAGQMWGEACPAGGCCHHSRLWLSGGQAGSVSGECVRGVWPGSVVWPAVSSTDCRLGPTVPPCQPGRCVHSALYGHPLSAPAHLTCPASTLQCQSSGPSTGSPPSTCSALTWCCVESPACVGALSPPPPPSPQHMLM